MEKADEGMTMCVLGEWIDIDIIMEILNGRKDYEEFKKEWEGVNVSLSIFFKYHKGTNLLVFEDEDGYGAVGVKVSDLPEEESILSLKDKITKDIKYVLGADAMVEFIILEKGRTV